MKVTTSLKKNYQFLRVYRKGTFVVGKYLVLYYLNNNNKGIRLGITTSKKVGNSVLRNRIRRLLKENYRKIETFILENIDIVFVVRANEKVPTYHEVKKEMKYLLKKAGIIDSSGVC